MLALTSDIMLPTGMKHIVRVCACFLFVIIHLNIPTSGLIVAVALETLYISNCKCQPTAFAKMLVYSALYNVNESKACA